MRFYISNICIEMHLFRNGPFSQKLLCNGLEFGICCCYFKLHFVSQSFGKCTSQVTCWITSDGV